MAIIYGSAVTNPTADTELGLAFPQAGGNQTTLQAPKGDIKTVDTFVAGSGYSLGPGGLPKEIILTATGGNGTGATFRATTTATSTPNGTLKATSSVKNAASFDNLQSRLAEVLDVASSNFTFARVTATGIPADSTSTAVVGTSATGNLATFIVTIVGGQVTGANVSAVGSGYLVGDVVTITKAALEAGLTGITVQGDTQLVLSEDNVLGGITATIEVLDSGQGYQVNDTLTLSEEGSGVTGTATVDVATLGESKVTSTQLRYPIGIKIGEPGATIAAPKTVELKQVDGTQVVIGGLITGSILPMTFSEITAAGTDLDLAQTTIFYR